jgi:LmbE family N-acetylglucosaminyl deacetylase
VKALVLHAHPDDELLFAGALMLSKPDWTWTTVSLTNGRPYPGISLGFADDWRVLHRREYEAWRDAVAALDLQPDIVVTHNLLGEYGHPHHMAVHAIAHELFERIWDFYTPAPSSVGPQARREVIWSVPVRADKRPVFDVTYPGVYDELRADKPDLVETAFVREWFTA